MQKVLIISHDKVGPSMAGPGIRYHQIATVLAKSFDVTLATFNPAYLEGLENTAYKFKDIKTYDFKSDFDGADVIFALWLSPEMISYAKEKDIRIVFDMYAPVPVEELIGRVFGLKTTSESDYDYSVLLENYRSFFRTGDFFVCSNPIQKDFWTGYALSSGAAIPSEYKHFPIYDRIDLLPMGIDLEELKNATGENPFPAHFDSISKDDFIIVWTGGIWDWFDAGTPIRAIKQLVDSGNTDIKLVFLGTRHPNTDVPEMSETARAYELSKELGLYGKNVLFLEGWIEYSKRIDYLLNASLALYAHKPSIEAQFSHRTRVLDHILTKLPTIATHGDYLGGIIDERSFGMEVTPQNVNEMSDAILKFARDPKLYAKTVSNIEKAQKEFTWDVTTLPLQDFIKSTLEARPITKAPSVITVGNSPAFQKIKKRIPKSVKRQIKKRLGH